ncbi:hypothetical protein, partial [Mesorhizobium sp. M2D.F.Ca.ET.233.01.1.1]|uniref:hypothetical protein n=1 Tax=Mesorhizobium sp. M2D.F.Ca.ET.233.01.1.1 TaxID=2563943 RepID=UPI001AED2025
RIARMVGTKAVATFCASSPSVIGVVIALRYLFSRVLSCGSIAVTVSGSVISSLAACIWFSAIAFGLVPVAVVALVEAIETFELPSQRFSHKRAYGGSR